MEPCIWVSVLILPKSVCGCFTLDLLCAPAFSMRKKEYFLDIIVCVVIVKLIRRKRKETLPAPQEEKRNKIGSPSPKSGGFYIAEVTVNI